MNQRTDITDQHLFDRSEITLVVDEIDNAVDAKDWQRCRNYRLRRGPRKRMVRRTRKVYT